jgi:hypothetical protein
MPYAKGDRVNHPGKPEWGLGKVLEDSSSSTVRVFFVGSGEKQMSLAHVTLQLVTGANAKHPVLDNLPLAPSAKGVEYESVPQSISRFLERFPQGFYDDEYLDQERNYKVAAHELALALLGKQTFTKMIKAQEFDEICKRAMHVCNSTNLIFPNEKMALKDGLKGTAAKKLFSETLHQLLFGLNDLEARFNTFCNALEELNAAKWTTATYFPFLMFPEKYIFLKPTITKNAAAQSGFEINYRPQLNWITYKRVLGFAEELRKELAALKPRDMIDVQSFMWCVAPDQ